MVFLFNCRLKCDYLGIDIQDDMGRHEVGFVENTIKTPIGADEEGCLFEARFHINKVRSEFPALVYIKMILLANPPPSTRT